MLLSDGVQKPLNVLLVVVHGGARRDTEETRQLSFQLHSQLFIQHAPCNCVHDVDLLASQPLVQMQNDELDQAID